MTIAKLHNLNIKSVDFVQTYPEALVKSSVYLYPPAGIYIYEIDQEETWYSS